MTTTPAALEAVAPGDFVGPYQVRGNLGTNGASRGSVFLAEHQTSKKKVMLAVMRPEDRADAAARQKFIGEARALRSVKHEKLVEILDFGQTTDGQPYFIMEFLEGEALSEAVARGPMTPEEVEAIGVQMMRALWAAHASDPCALLN